MRVFVAGANGAVGRRLVPMLVARGHKVTGDDLADYVERVIKTFDSQRESGERFAQWVARADEAALL